MTALVTGGSGSGKSAWAEALACALAPGRKYYLATMYSGGAEAQARIARHRRQRAGRGFETVECPEQLDAVPVGGEDTALLECLSNLTANVMFSSGISGGYTEHLWAQLEGLMDRCGSLVIVSNEIFSDGITYDPGTAAYLETLGTLNRLAARRADLVVEVVCGIPVPLKGTLPASVKPPLF